MSRRGFMCLLSVLVLSAGLAIQAVGQDREEDPERPLPSTTEGEDLEEKPVVLLTGFGPFGSHRVNPSWVGAEGVDGRTIEGHKVVSVELPVDFREVWEQVPELLKKHKPAVVIHFGVFRNGPLRLERQARNSIGTLGDVVGYYPEDGRVVEDGPMMLETRLPEEALIKGMPEAGFDMVPSEDAGRYVCEFTFYTEIYFQEKLGQSASAGFVHVAPFNRPLSGEQLTEAMAKAVEIVLKQRAEDSASENENSENPSSQPAPSTAESDNQASTENPAENSNSAGEETGGSTSSAGLTGALRGEGENPSSRPSRPESRPARRPLGRRGPR